jgi:hypothetical protein
MALYLKYRKNRNLRRILDGGFGGMVEQSQLVKPTGIVVNALRVRLHNGFDLVVARAAAHLINPSAVCPVP